MGIKDTSYASLFDKKDLPYIYRLAEEVRATHNQDLVNEFNECCKKKWNDHHNPTLEIGNRRIEFLQTMKSLDGDLVVDQGMQRMLDHILGASTDRWTKIYTATGNAAAAITDSNLTFAGGGLTSTFATSGWAEFAGASLRFAGIYGESTATITPREVGTCNTAISVFLNRNVFENNNFIHTINVNGFVISNVIEFVPVM